MPVKTAWNAYGGQTVVVGKHRILGRQCQRVGACVFDPRNSGCRGRQQQDVDVFEGLARDGFSVGFVDSESAARPDSSFLPSRGGASSPIVMVMSSDILRSP